MINRREFLGSGLKGAAALACLPDVLHLPQSRRAEPSEERILVVLQLRGGNDGLNTVVPVEDDHYRRARPTLGLRKQDLLRIDDLNRFHWSLRKTQERYARGQVAIVQRVGYPNPNLSHFSSQDYWDAGTSQEPLPDTGWLGKFCDVHLEGKLRATTMLAIGRDMVPHAMRAKRSVACAIPSLAAYRISESPRGSSARETAARRKAMQAMNAGTGEMRNQAQVNAVRAARLSIAELARVRGYRPRVQYPKTRLAQQLQLVASVIGQGIGSRFFYVTQDGYDTHVGQLESHEQLLGQFDGAVEAFLGDLERQGKLAKTLVMTISDFGRRVAESGIGPGAGTDHGAASMLLLMGGKVKGGLYGGQPELAKLDQNGNLTFATDFRQVYATVIEDWLGGNAAKVLGKPVKKLELIST